MRAFGLEAQPGQIAFRFRLPQLQGIIGGNDLTDLIPAIPVDRNTRAALPLDADGCQHLVERLAHRCP